MYTRIVPIVCSLSLGLISGCSFEGQTDSEKLSKEYGMVQLTVPTPNAGQILDVTDVNLKIMQNNTILHDETISLFGTAENTAASTTVVVPAGLYSFVATPLQPSGQKSHFCKPVSRSRVEVRPSGYVNLIVNSNCGGDPSGTFKTTIGFNLPPHFSHIDIENPRPCVNEPNNITVTAASLLEDTHIEYSWTVHRKPKNARADDYTLVSDGATATFVSKIPTGKEVGYYVIRVQAKDSGGTHGLLFLLESTDSEDCRPVEISYPEKPTRTISLPQEFTSGEFPHQIAYTDSMFAVATSSSDTSTPIAFLYDADGEPIDAFYLPIDAEISSLLDSSVALSDNYLVVGANGAPDGEGKVYVFEPKEGGDLLHTLRDPNLGGNDNFFGEAVAIAGENIIVATLGPDPQYEEDGHKLHVFSAEKGTHKATLFGPAPPNPLEYYSVLAASDRWVVVAAPEGSAQEGAVYLYDLTNSPDDSKLIYPTHSFLPPTSIASLSMSGNLIAMGSIVESSEVDGAGQIYLFDADTQSSIGVLQIPQEAIPASYFMVDVAIAGNFVLASAPNIILEEEQRHEHGDLEDVGSAFLFDITSGKLIHRFNNPTPASGDYFGFHMAMSNDNVIIGAEQNDSGGLPGVVYLYQKN